MMKTVTTKSKNSTDKVYIVNVEKAYTAAKWLSELKNTSNRTFIPLYLDSHRYLVLKGGGGSGKSAFAARKVVERAVCEPGHRFLVCRKVGRTIKQSVFRLLVETVKQFYPDEKVKVNNTDYSIIFPCGSEIICAGLDDVEKLKSIYEITDVWIEEATEILKSDFNQLDIRMRGKSPYYQQMIITFNPISILHWLKKQFFDRFDSDVKIHESNYLDNRFLPEQNRRTLEKFKETDEYFYQVYCLGNWGITGKTVFDAKKLSERYSNLPSAKYGYFNIKYSAEQISGFDYTDCERTEISEKQGLLKVFSMPKEGYPYVIGVDTAGDGSDSFVAQVLDNTTGEQVAIMRQQVDEDVFAHRLFCLGKLYNTALIGVETNFSTYVVRELERLRYPKQYVRERYDDYTHKTVQSFGFRTDTKTRPVLVSELCRVVRENVDTINDDTTISEMLTFVRDENFKPCAEEGAHDDCVMALGIAHQLRNFQSCVPAAGEGKKVKWHKSQWEDYYAADSATRKMLIDKWGNPEKE